MCVFAITQKKTKWCIGFGYLARESKRGRQLEEQQQQQQRYVKKNMLRVSRASSTTTSFAYLIRLMFKQKQSISKTLSRSVSVSLREASVEKHQVSCIFFTSNERKFKRNKTNKKKKEEIKQSIHFEFVYRPLFLCSTILILIVDWFAIQFSSS